MKNMVISIRYSELTYLYTPPPAVSWEAYYGPEATLSIIVLDRTFFSEPSVKVAEFATQLWAWHKNGLKRNKDFVYLPIDSELKNFFSIRADGHAWRLSSAIHRYYEERIFLSEEISDAVILFLAALSEDLNRNFGIDKTFYMKPVRFY